LVLLGTESSLVSYCLWPVYNRHGFYGVRIILQELVLISVSGLDKPGLTSSFTDLLAKLEANVLDIGQSVIHQHLSLGILVEVPGGLDTIETALREQASKAGMAVHFEAISEQSYNDWVGQQGKPRHIVTLLARRISARQINRIADVLAGHNLNIDNITRMSGRVPLHEINLKAQACVEFSVRGEVQEESTLRRSLMALASEFEVDIAFQQDNVFRRNRRVVAFDMDSTLIQMEVIDELAKRAGVGDQVSEITEQAMRGELDFQQSFRKRVALLAGTPETVLEEVAENLQLSDGAEKLIRVLKKLGYKTAILSGGFTYFGQLLQKKLGIDYVYANDLEIADGKVTGQVSGQIVDGERKAQLLRHIAEKENIDLEQVIAVGDGANDLPMLSIAGLGIAFRAKPIVKASAKQALSTHGLDGILYLLGLSEKELD